ncbi:MAG: hypothetical protein KIT24_03265 [Phycisphaeraceae bacterium]|nr:hypothetical protein [Phycisphaeraceae bacterium]
MPGAHELARSAAERLERLGAASVGRLRVLVGFDGFVDSIIHVVARRRSMRVDDYERIRTIAEFAARCAAASGRSTNIERVVLEERFGGNGPLMAGALGRLGCSVSFVGAVGKDDQSRELLDVFRPFAARCRRVVAVGRPGLTDAMEFDDGKLMLNQTAQVQSVTWERLIERLGEKALSDLVDHADLIGIVNWSLCGGVEGIWRGLRTQVLPRLAMRERRLYVDLSDPAKRTDEDVGHALAELRLLHEAIDVTLGLNLAEAERIAQVLGVVAFEEGAHRTLGDAVAHAAGVLRQATGLGCVVVHPRQGAAAATAEERVWVDGPFTLSPRLSTGAGDHFNAGFSMARSLGLSLGECLSVGTGVSGAYVRDAASPTLDRLCGFLRALPAPE